MFLNKRKRLFKKLYEVKHFYTDDSKRFEFYYRKNWLDQFDVMVVDVQQNTNRWFMVTAPIFVAMLNLEKDEQLRVYKANIEKSAKPKVANELIHNHQFKLISHKTAKFNGETIIAKLGEFGVEKERQRVLLLKRIAFVPEKDNLILGMDTMEIPFIGINKLVADIKKTYFKNADLEIVDEEEENATDKN
jgi:hypothetical protein